MYAIFSTIPQQTYRKRQPNLHLYLSNSRMWPLARLTLTQCELWTKRDTTDIASAGVADLSGSDGLWDKYNRTPVCRKARTDTNVLGREDPCLKTRLEEPIVTMSQTRSLTSSQSNTTNQRNGATPALENRIQHSRRRGAYCPRHIPHITDAVWPSATEIDKTTLQHALVAQTTRVAQSLESLSVRTRL